MLLRDITTFRNAAPVNRNMAFDSLRPFVETAEMRYIKTAVLGKDQYDALDAAITADDLTPEQQALLDLVQKAIAHFALYEAVPQLSIMFSDGGIQEPQSDRTSPAAQWRVAELRANYWGNAQVWRQAVQEHLQENQADYPLWVDSRAFTVFNGLFIRTAAELSAVIGMSEDIASFVAMRPAIERAEETYLRGALSLAFMTDLKEKMAANDLSTLEATVVDMCRKACGHYALFEALPMLTVAMREGVLQVVTNNANALKLYQPLSDTQRQELLQKAGSDGRSYLVTLKEFLEANADDLPIYKGSTAYEGEEPMIKLPENYGYQSFML